MKLVSVLSFILFLSVAVQAQIASADSLRRILQQATSDSLEYEARRALYNFYEEVNRDSALQYAEQELELAKKNDKKLVEALALDTKGYQLLNMGRFSEAVQCFQEAFTITENSRNDVHETWTLSISPTKLPGKSRLLMLALTHHMMGILMWQTKNSELEIYHFKQARRIGGEIGNPYRVLLADMNLANCYLRDVQADSAMIFAKEAEQISIQSGIKKYLGHIYSTLGELSMNAGKMTEAKQYFYQGVQLSREQNNSSALGRNYYRLVQFYLARGDKDSTLWFAQKQLQTIQSMGSVLGIEQNIGTAYESMYKSYNLRGQVDSSFKYLHLALNANDSISKIRINNLAAFQKATFNEQLRLQNLEKEKEVYQSRLGIYILLAGLAIVMLLMGVLYLNNRERRKANTVLENTVSNLKAAQAQLIQSEKMASLGELTAGIAHEIQNPLNFVNNFSEVSNELIDEMKVDLVNGNYQEANVLANDVKQNLEKINHHGKRADSIVKGMLQHSRTSTGLKEPTDINALCDEYLRLSYHGIRAKDSNFNASLKTEFDNSIKTPNIVSQDIGRVLLNIFNNAFYAVGEKKRLQKENYEPVVSVSTKKTGDRIEISVSDNGKGIPQNIRDKIFQPFFTTKPAGQGTGLGLSLAYDIVKAHGGGLTLSTTEGQGTVFTIQLPVGPV